VPICAVCRSAVADWAFFFTAVFAISIVSVLIVVRLLDYPFEGALRLSNGDFIKTIEHIKNAPLA
jgi:hypothetical protein